MTHQTLLGLALVGLSGCFLPVSTATPQGTRTAGKGKLAVNGAAEYPVLDHLAVAAQPPSPSQPERDRHPVSSAPHVSLMAKYGLTDNLDLEGSVQGEWQVIIPIPHTLTVGARYVPFRGCNWDLGISGHIGGSLGGGEAAPYDDVVVSALHATLGLHATMVRWRDFQPVFGAAVQPIRLQATAMGGEGAEPLHGLATAATVGFTLWDTVTPFGTAGWYTGDRIGGVPFFTFGLAFHKSAEMPKLPF